MCIVCCAHVHLCVDVFFSFVRLPGFNLSVTILTAPSPQLHHTHCLPLFPSTPVWHPYLRPESLVSVSDISVGVIIRVIRNINVNIIASINVIVSVSVTLASVLLALSVSASIIVNVSIIVISFSISLIVNVRVRVIVRVSVIFRVGDIVSVSFSNRVIININV